MRRREFIALVGAVVAWPLTGHAQHSSMPVIGFLRSTSLTTSAHLVTAFREGLKEASFVEGRNVVIEYRSAEDQSKRTFGDEFFGNANCKRATRPEIRDV